MRLDFYIWKGESLRLEVFSYETIDNELYFLRSSLPFFIQFVTLQKKLCLYEADSFN